MRPNGIIYQSQKPKVSGETRLALSFGRRLAYHFLRTFGAGLVASAIAAIIFSVYPIVKEEYLYYFGTKEQAEISKFGEILGRSQAQDLGIDPYFSLYIPKIAARARVGANVDAGKPSEYLAALTEGVAHAKGTNYPGQGKTIFLFSHSTDSPVNIARYNAIFYLLRKLEAGDRIIVYFMGQEHVYIVTDRFTISAFDTSWMADDGSGERLILQTCDPPGTSWRRLLVIARPLGQNTH